MTQAALSRKSLMAAMLAVVCALSGAPALASESPLVTGAAANALLPENAGVSGNDVVEAGDHLSIKVMGEEDLTGEYVVDDSGNFQFPLLGVIPVAGMTTRDLLALLTTRMGSRYLRDPAIAVAVVARPAATFTIEGSVKNPGRYDLGSGMTLLGAVAMGASPIDTAKLSNVVVFRDLNGRHYGARFNLSDIRAGRAPNPQIIQGDIVVVGSSAIKVIWKDILQAAPLFNLFYYLR